MKIISIVSGKGGVGKTASSVNIATLLAMKGKKVLIMDLDKQSNTTKHLKAYNISEKSICNIILDRINPNEIIKKTEIEGLDIIPGAYDLEDVPDKILLDINRSRMTRLKEIENLNYDFVIIDCPPSLDIITMNALVISDYVLVPVKIDEWGIEGFEKITRKIQIVRDEYNAKLKLLGCFVTMDNRTKINSIVKGKLEKSLKDKYFKTTIRQGKSLVESTFAKIPVVKFEQKCNVSIDYNNLVNEILKKI